MSKKQKHKERKPRCHRCLHPGFTLSHDTHDGRPRFTCGQCGETWTNGHDGGEYTAAVLTKE